MNSPQTKQPEERKTNILRIRLTEDERALLDEHATFRGLETSTWARSELLQLIRRQKAKIK